MAGDWIKMRGNLWDDPRVARVCDATDQGEAAVIGALYWLWATADQHTESGEMVGLSLRQIDRKTGVQGFGQALQDIGWIQEVDGGILIVRFGEHNGKSAKRRAQEAKRKASVRDMSASDADNVRNDGGSGAELEKERELEIEVDKKQSGSGKQNPSKRKRAVALPEDFTPSDRNRELAGELNVSLPTELAKFTDYHKAKGSTFKDWHAALNNWLRNAKEFQGGKSQPPAQVSNLKEFRG